MALENSDIIAVQKAADSVVWRKTDYISPHEYIIREKTRNAWDIIAKAIDEHGVIKKFYGKDYKYLYLGDYMYWHYQKVLNRALIKLTE